MGALNKLSARFVETVKVPGVYGDGGNLYLQVQELERKGGEKAIAKSWLFRFMREGRAREMGPYHPAGRCAPAGRRMPPATHRWLRPNRGARPSPNGGAGRRSQAQNIPAMR